MTNEPNTCRLYVEPKLREAGWEREPHDYTEQYYFTAGKIQPRNKRKRRGERKFVDYLLLYQGEFPIAVVEAKRKHKTPDEGLEQAIDYAKLLGVKFAYSTNGKGIVEFDFITGKQSEEKGIDFEELKEVTNQPEADPFDLICHIAFDAPVLTYKLREDEAELAGATYKPTIKPPYRWRDWAANENFTGDRLKNFINDDEATLPDGKKGLGLLTYLRSLKSKTGRDPQSGSRQRRGRADVMAKVFKDVNNRMISGTLLFDVLSKINEIHFNRSEEVNILSLLYESMLKEMRDAAGDSGEFYTPRPVIRFMVEVMAPKIGQLTSCTKKS